MQKRNFNCLYLLCLVSFLGSSSYAIEPATASKDAEAQPAKALLKTMGSMAGNYEVPTTYMDGKKVDSPPPPSQLEIIKVSENLVILNDSKFGSQVTFTPISSNEILMTQIHENYHESFSAVGEVKGSTVVFRGDSQEQLDGVVEEDDEVRKKKNAAFIAYIEKISGAEVRETDDLRNLSFTFDEQGYSAAVRIVRPEDQDRVIFSMKMVFEKKKK